MAIQIKFIFQRVNFLGWEYIVLKNGHEVRLRVFQACVANLGENLRIIKIDFITSS